MSDPIIIAGTVGNTGGIVAGTGFTSAPIKRGVFRISFNKKYKTLLSVVTTAWNIGNPKDACIFAIVSEQGPDGFTVWTSIPNGELSNYGFFFIAAVSDT